MKGQKRKINYSSCVNRKAFHTKGNGDHMRIGVVKICLTGNLRPEKKLLREKSEKKFGADFAQKCVVPKYFERLINAS